MATKTAVSREVYPNAPLRLAAFELRTSQVPEFGSREGTMKLYEQLRDHVPIIPPAPQAQLEIQTAGMQPAVFHGGPLLMLDRRRTTSVTVGPSVLIIQTTAYTRFEAFRDFIERVLRATEKVALISAVERVGLRYLDEIRIDGVEEPADWEAYISPNALAAIQSPLNFEAASFTTSVEFVVSDRQRVNMRLGALRGRVVDPTGPLKLPSSPDGAFFLVDADSFWAPPTDDIPAFSVGNVLSIASDLHAPARGLFESVLLESAREFFRRDEVASV